MFFPQCWWDVNWNLDRTILAQNSELKQQFRPDCHIVNNLIKVESWNSFVFVFVDDEMKARISRTQHSIIFQHFKMETSLSCSWETEVKKLKPSKVPRRAVIDHGYSRKLLYKCNLKLFVQWFDFILIYSCITIGHKVLNELP